ncbi:MAG: 50S ribosomal protein L10 [Actinomycetes bacterium]
MARPDKVAAVAELTEEFRSSNAAVLTEYRGLTVAQLQELRRALGEHVSYAVVKNTLTKFAAREAGVDQLDEQLLTGPTAVAFVKGDPVEAAKGLRDFAKAHPALVVKGGIMDGRSMSPDELTRLADLESREVLLSKLAGVMKAKQSQTASLFAAPLSKTVRTVEALRAKVEASDGPAEPVASASAGGTEPDAPSEEAAAAGEPAGESSPQESAPDESTPQESTESSEG